MTVKFEQCFNHAMIYEVGAFWNPKDPEVIAGLCSTKDQKRKVGYVNIPQDAGGETKFGVALNANPGLNIKTLTLSEAMVVYEKKYWNTISCEQMPLAISLWLFDCGVNHGTRRAAKFLQTALGVTADGQIGPGTLGALAKADQKALLSKLKTIRQNFYESIVQNKPSQKMFLAGWTRRNNEVTDFSLSLV